MTSSRLQRVMVGLLAVALAGCGSGPGGPGGPGGAGGPASGLAIAAVPRAAAEPAEAVLAGDAINDFGLELLRAATRGDESAVLSPASVVIALAMARAGARGETARQMDAVLREVAAEAHPGWLNALDAALASRSGTFQDAGGEDRDVILRIANAPFAQRDYPWEDAFLRTLAERYGAGIRLVDYATDHESARRAINGWVDERTERRIGELLAQGVIDEDTRLVLVSAIYLMAAWLTPFITNGTVDRPFGRLDGSTVDVPTMHVVADLRYAAGSGWQAVDIPYVGGSLAMTIIVPDDLAAFEANLDGRSFEVVAGALEDRRVDLWLPKFGLETKVDLATVMATMGMPDAFDPGLADFGAMTTADQLYIKAVIHQANIDVDEHGSEAAAATAVVLNRVSMPPPPVEVRVDRPFLLALRDVPTGAILFMGRIVEPEVRAE